MIDERVFPRAWSRLERWADDEAHLSSLRLEAAAARDAGEACEATGAPASMAAYVLHH